MDGDIATSAHEAERLADSLVEAIEDFKAAKHEGLPTRKRQAAFSLFRAFKSIMRADANWEEGG